MRSPTEIREIARTRLYEAKHLYDGDFREASYYLIGYSVELMLKAKICEQFGIPNLYDIDAKEPSDQKQYLKLGEIRRAVKVHNLFQLLVYSGLKEKLDEASSTDRSLKKTISLLFGIWDESCRYWSPGRVEVRVDLDYLIDELDGPSGLLTWIENN